jgi:iron complex outermembrane receptor protein
MDIRYAWRPCDGLELALVGQNLLEKDHLEYIPVTGSTEVESGVYGMISWEY